MQQHNITITDDNQPMLISKRTRGRGGEETIALVPELCLESGLSDDMRSDFRMMLELGKLIKPTPGDRLSRSAQLIERMGRDSQCASLINDYGIRINANPCIYKGGQLRAGKIVFGNGKIHDLDSKSSFDREAQSAMLSMPPLARWAIV